MGEICSDKAMRKLFEKVMLDKYMGGCVKSAMNIKRKNLGSTTIEMCFVMPVVVVITIFCLMLLLIPVNDIKRQEMSYSAIYTYSGDAENNINEQLMLYEENGFVCGNAKSIKESVYYKNKKVTYKTEYDKCTPRLRRWQMYGDIFQE